MYEDLQELIIDLRLFTAVGNTKKPFDLEDIDIDITAKYVTQDEDGTLSSKQNSVDFCFYHPLIEYYDEVIMFDDLEKAEIKKKERVTRLEGSYNDKLLGIKDSNLQIMAVFGNDELFKKWGIPATIVLGVRGAPMPVEIRPPQTGFSGYWRNLFILINRDDVKLDAGRKSINRSDKRALNDRLKEFFNKYVAKYAKLFMEPKGSILTGVLEQLKEQARNKEDLQIPAIPFEKVPVQGEELAVVGIFHELIGAGILQGYKTLSSSTDSQYDEIVKYQIPIDSLGKKTRANLLKESRKIREKLDKYTQIGFIEFKVDAIEFMKDCDQGKKDPKDIMLLVAYDLSKTKIRKNWEVGSIPNDEHVFSGANLKLIYRVASIEIPLILLKEFRQIDSLTKDGYSDWTPE